MCTAVLAIALVAQTQLPRIHTLNQPSLEVMEKMAEAEKAQALSREIRTPEQQIEEREFVESFNALVKAMGTFSAKYQAGHVIDAKAVDSIRKAYKRLESADPWFKVKK